MKVCSFCGYKFTDNVNDYSAYCPNCEDKMLVTTIEEVYTDSIDTHDHGISMFADLDFKAQREFIMASNGTDKEKLEMLNKYIDKNDTFVTCMTNGVTECCCYDFGDNIYKIRKPKYCPICGRKIVKIN